MSIYAYLVCEDCAQFLFLGKALRTDADVIFDFWNGGPLDTAPKRERWCSGTKPVACLLRTSTTPFEYFVRKRSGPCWTRATPGANSKAGGPPWARRRPPPNLRMGNSRATDRCPHAEQRRTFASAHVWRHAQRSTPYQRGIPNRSIDGGVRNQTKILCDHSAARIEARPNPPLQRKGSWGYAPGAAAERHLRWADYSQELCYVC
jgi:hypothetical protein